VRFLSSRYLDEQRGRPIDDVWIDIPPVNSQAIERLGYPTQKPEALLERIFKASSNEGDLVLDCFAGSATTASVAEKLGRPWIACDLGRFAIHTTRKRLLTIPDVRPFIVQNLGKYERQLWQTGQFAKDGPETPEQAAQRHRAYVEFILSLYGASPIKGRTWLHGVRAGRMVHVSSVEAPAALVMSPRSPPSSKKPWDPARMPRKQTVSIFWAGTLRFGLRLVPSLALLALRVSFNAVAGASDWCAGEN
jgi:adenine-specific DNA-methyltransferase